MDTKHNPEFTMLEFYQAYSNYEDIMNLTEEMLRYVAQKVLGTTTVVYGNDEIDLGKLFAHHHEARNTPALTLTKSTLWRKPALLQKSIMFSTRSATSRATS